MSRFKTTSHYSVESYFNFSRSQRRAIIFILFSAISLGYYVQSVALEGNSPEPSSFIAAGKLNNILSVDSFKTGSAHERSGRAFEKYAGKKTFQPAPLKGTLSYFDPNKADFEELMALGMGEKAAKNLIHYREKGGRFKKPGDLAKLYSLKSAEVERLVPWVRIEETPENASNTRKSDAEIISPAAAAPKYKPIPVSVNINKADSIIWQLLPGIGAKRAASILKFREKLGGFVSIEQVGETWGLPDSVFQKIKANLTWQPGQIEQLNLNTASEAELKAHPYIGWQWAKIIVAYRTQHGNYQTVDDLLKIHIMNKEWLEQVRPYLKAD